MSNTSDLFATLFTDARDLGAGVVPLGPLNGVPTGVPAPQAQHGAHGAAVAGAAPVGVLPLQAGGKLPAVAGFGVPLAGMHTFMGAERTGAGQGVPMSVAGAHQVVVHAGSVPGGMMPTPAPAMMPTPGTGSAPVKKAAPKKGPGRPRKSAGGAAAADASKAEAKPRATKRRKTAPKKDKAGGGASAAEAGTAAAAADGDGGVSVDVAKGGAAAGAQAGGAAGGKVPAARGKAAAKPPKALAKPRTKKGAAAGAGKKAAGKASTAASTGAGQGGGGAGAAAAAGGAKEKDGPPPAKRQKSAPKVPAPKALSATEMMANHRLALRILEHDGDPLAGPPPNSYWPDGAMPPRPAPLPPHPTERGGLGLFGALQNVTTLRLFLQLNAAVNGISRVSVSSAELMSEAVKVFLRRLIEVGIGSAEMVCNNGGLAWQPAQPAPHGDGQPQPPQGAAPPSRMLRVRDMIRGLQLNRHVLGEDAAVSLERLYSTLSDEYAPMHLHRGGNGR